MRASALHVRKGKPFALAFTGAQVGVLLEECGGLGLERGKVDSSGVPLDFVEVKSPVDFVFADKIDFVFALSVPPAAHARVGRVFGEFPAEVSFERIAGEGVYVPGDEGLYFFEPPKFDHGLVAVYEAEPEPEEAVVYSVAAVLGARPLEYRLGLGDDGVVSFKFCEISPYVSAEQVLQFRERGFAAGDSGEDCISISLPKNFISPFFLLC